jgi:hypothetical protein
MKFLLDRCWQSDLKLELSMPSVVDPEVQRLPNPPPDLVEGSPIRVAAGD